MRTATKWVGGVGLAIIAVLLIGIAVVAWAIGTNSGARWLFDRVAALVDAELHADTIAGTLASSLTFQDLRYVAADGSLELRADTAPVEVDLAALLQRTLHVESARISGLTVVSRTTEAAERTGRESAAGPLDPALTVIVDDADVLEAHVTRDGEPILDIQRLALAGRWTDAAIAIDDLDMQATQADLQLAGELRHDGTNYAVNARGEFEYSMGERGIAGTLRADTEQETVTLAVQLSDPTQARFFARVQQRQTLSWSLEAQVPKFDPSVLGIAQLQSLALSLEGSGTGAGGAISGSIVMDGEPLRLHPLQFTIDRRRIGIDLLAAVGAERSEVSATGEILLGAEQPWRADLDVKWAHVTLPPALMGQTLVTRGELQLTGNLQQFGAQGTLALGPPDRVADIQLDVTGSSQRLRIDELRIVQPVGFLRATGELVREPRLRWDLQASASSFDPGAFFPDWPGNLQFELDTDGSVTDAGPRGELLLSKLSGRLRGHPLSGSADLQLTSRPSLAGQLQLQSGASRLRVSADRGKAWDATATIEIASLEAFLPRASGSLDGRFSITGEWPSLDVAGSARATNLLVGEVAVDSARLQLDIEGLRTPSGSAQLRADGITVADMTFDSASIDLAGAEQRHTLTARATGTPGSIQLRATGGLKDEQGDPRWTGTIRRLVLDLRDMQPLTLANPAGLVASRSLVDLSRLCLTSADGRLCAVGEVRFDGAQGGAWVDGSVSAAIPDIATFTLLSTNVANLDGRVRLQAEVEGRLADPALRLDLRAEQLAAEIPRLGLQLRDGVIDAESRGENQIAVSGSIRSGEGRLTVAGTVTPAGHANLQIDGEQLLAADIAGARVIAAPELHFVRGPQGMLLEGRVTIPAAQINVQQLRPVNRLETGSPDVVIIGAKTQPEAQAETFPLRADVTVELGEDVTVSGFGLEAEVDGQVAIREVPDQPTVASGEVHVEGTYQAFGQDLTITRGRVLYADSPLDNPRLNVVAAREVQDVTAGVRITGPAQSPELTVFSDPAMDEANALAYLLTGRPLGEIGDSEREGDLMTSAAESLGGAAGGLLAKRIGERLGLDVATVEESELTGTQVFTVGEYLSPRLYVGYGVGLFEPGDVITLRYRLSDDVAVRAVRGPEESRLGVEYRVER